MSLGCGFLEYICWLPSGSALIVFYVSSLIRPWFIYWYKMFIFIDFGCIYYFIGCFWFICFVDCVNLVLWNRRSDGFLYNILFWFPSFVNYVIIHLFDKCFSSSDQCLLVSSKYPLVFLTFSLGLSDPLGNGPMILYDMISVLDLLHPVNSIISSIF